HATDSRVSTNAPLSSFSPFNSFDLQQIAASLEDKLDIRMNRFEKSLNDMKAFVTSPAPIKAVEEDCLTCGSNHSYNHCPLTRGGNEFPIFHDNIQQFQTAAVGNKETEVKNVVEQPAKRGSRIIESLQNFRVIQPEYSTSMGYENPNTTPETKSDEIIKSGVEELVPIISENEVTLEDKKECDVPVCESSPVYDDHSVIFSDSKNDDDISSDDDEFEDIEY
nr:hypothetical protein [Tanacetum cinerariifolium]